MGYQIKTLTSDMEAAWDQYALQNKSSLYHLVAWKHLIKKVFGHHGYYLYALDDQQQIVGILPMIRMKSFLFGDFLISMPYFNYGGIIANNVEVETELFEAAEKLRAELGCSHAELRDKKEIQTDLPTRTDKVTMLLDLPKDFEVLNKSIGAKRRSQAKRPIREGATFEHGGLDLLDDFYHVFSINMRDLGTPVYSKKLFRTILETFPDQAFLGIVRLEGEAVGAGFLIGHQGTLEIPWASTLRKVNRIGVNMYLYWNILRIAIEKGYKIFDFGRSSEDAGTLRFKKQWGGEQHQLYWYYLMRENEDIPVMNHSNKKYQLVINTWKKLPVPLTKIIGPQIIRNIP